MGWRKDDFWWESCVGSGDWIVLRDVFATVGLLVSESHDLGAVS